MLIDYIAVSIFINKTKEKFRQLKLFDVTFLQSSRYKRCIFIKKKTFCDDLVDHINCVPAV